VNHRSVSKTSELDRGVQGQSGEISPLHRELGDWRDQLGRREERNDESRRDPEAEREFVRESVQGGAVISAEVASPRGRKTRVHQAAARGNIEAKAGFVGHPET
jgi:hypothetical protein